MLYGVTCKEVLISAQGDGTAVTAAAATTLLPPQAKGRIPANWHAIGKRLKIYAAGKISSVITTPGTARFDVRFGAAVVFDGLAVLLDTAAAYVNVAWELEINLTCRAIGTAGNLMGHGRYFSTNILGQPATAPKGGLVAMLPWNSTPAVGANFDTTAEQVVDLFFTQTVGTGSITLNQYELELSN